MAALDDGRLDEALRILSTHSPTTATAAGVELLLAKINDSLASMAASADRHYVSVEEWKAIAEKNRKIWFNPAVRRLAQHFYPIAAPVVRRARRAGAWYRTRRDTAAVNPK